MIDDRDAARLQFMSDYSATIHWVRDREYCWISREVDDDGELRSERLARGLFNTPREAIDAAMKTHGS